MGMQKTTVATKPIPHDDYDDEMPTPPDDEGDLWGEADEMGYVASSMSLSTEAIASSLQNDTITRGDANDPQAWDESVGFAKQLLNGKVLD